MNIEHPPAMHHKRWRHDHCHRAETPRHSTKTTQRHCGQVERPTRPRRASTCPPPADRILNKVFCQFINWLSDPPASPERDNKRTKSIEYGSRWRAGATSLFDVRRFRQWALADSMLDVHLLRFKVRERWKLNIRQPTLNREP